jgi:riboflavin biosynthesis pyrimidine reductase
MAARVKNPRPPRVTAAFALSWDGRILEPLGPVPGAIDELRITWRPRIVGGKTAPSITGLARDFLPRGITLDLVKIERHGPECLAIYRLRPI